MDSRQICLQKYTNVPPIPHVTDLGNPSLIVANGS